MEIKAKLHVKYDTEQVTATFKKRRFVVVYAENPMYPQFVEFQLLQDRVSELDKFNPGDMMAVSFDIKGREWRDPKTGDNKYFNSLDAWRLQAVTLDTPAGAPAAGGGAYPPPPPPAMDVTAMQSDDDLPF